MPTQENGSGTTEGNTVFPAAGELQERLNSLLSDPESMGKLMQMASGLASSGLFSGFGTGNAPTEPEKPNAEAGEQPEKTSDPISASEKPQNTTDGTASPGGTDGASHTHLPSRGYGAGGKHAALLKALRPYMSEGRQSRIDQMLQLLQLTEAAEAILRPQGFLTGNTGRGER